MQKLVTLFFLFTCTHISAQEANITRKDFSKFLAYEGMIKNIPISYQQVFLDIAYQEPRLKLEYSTPGYPYLYMKNTQKRADRIYVFFGITGTAGLCSGTLLTEYSLKGKLKDSELFAFTCQQDEQDPVIEMADYAMLNDSIIEIRQMGTMNLDSPDVDDAVTSAGEAFLSFSYVIMGKQGLLNIQTESPRETDPQEAMLAHKIVRTEELKSLSKNQLRLKRNTIFALHGYRFQSADLNNYFLAQPWYVATAKSERDILQELNAIEKLNIAIIRKMEAQ